MFARNFCFLVPISSGQMPISPPPCGRPWYWQHFAIMRRIRQQKTITYYTDQHDRTSSVVAHEGTGHDDGDPKPGFWNFAQCRNAFCLSTHRVSQRSTVLLLIGAQLDDLSTWVAKRTEFLMPCMICSSTFISILYVVNFSLNRAIQKLSNRTFSAG